MLAVLATALAATLAGWLLLRWRRVRGHWARLRVPHEPPHPLMGSLTFLQKQNPALWMRRIYDKFRAPYVGIWLFWRPALVINSPEIARRVLVKDADNFRDRFLSSGKSDPIGALNMFTVNDPIWTAVRRRLTAVFTSAKLKTLHNLVNTKAKELVQRLRKEHESKKPIDVKTVLADYTTDIIGTASFGVNSDATLTGDSALRRVTRDFQAYSAYRGIAWSCIFFLPDLVDVFRLSFFPKATTDYLRKIFQTVVEQRGGYEGSGEGRDLLDALIKMKKDAANDNEEMSEDLLLSQAAVFLQGGFDTSASTLTFMFYELAFQPEIQEKLYQEIIEAKERNSNKEFEGSVYSDLTYLNCIIKETLRKYPAMGWLDRIAAKDYRVDDNLTISAGTPVYVNAVGMMVDPEYFPDPMKFDPDRFLPENEKGIPPFTYLPFGEGPRSCIGKRFGYQNMRYAIAAIAENFEIRPLPGAVVPDKVGIEKKGLFMMPELVNLDFVPRN